MNRTPIIFKDNEGDSFIVFLEDIIGVYKSHSNKTTIMISDNGVTEFIAIGNHEDIIQMIFNKSNQFLKT